MWTSTYKLRPVTRCKEGCRRQPPVHAGGFPLFLSDGARCATVHHCLYD